MNNLHIEKDSLGSDSISTDKLWGIHSQRAHNNFIKSGLPQSKYFYKALAQVKLAACKTNIVLGYIDPAIGNAMMTAIDEMIRYNHFEYFIVDPLQGGAGTSTNMNINEIIAKRTNQLLKKEICSPLEHVNLHQSTNDVYPSALKVAVSYYLMDLEQNTNILLQELQLKEKEFTRVRKIARTELMPAVPTTLGKDFSAYADVIGRDRWRIFKALERIRQINLGGTAIGTGLTAPKKYIFAVCDNLKKITGLPISRAENLYDATQNHDQIAEVFSMIKILAININKISNDLRLLASYKEIILKPLQDGSSIMPGKYNPVILEMLNQICLKVIGNDNTASHAISQGELELNARLPLIAYLIFESCDLLIQGIDKLSTTCIRHITADIAHCDLQLLNEPSTSTILIPKIGYKKAAEIAEYMIQKKTDIISACNALSVIDHLELEELLKAENICKLGYDE
ncbi:MAG: hypothetical protein A2Y40_01985 [Candidatus Margulisbacteria bacterium GWF2_35_9]|nr:MAG: hypothetical protein A2Y40_01985 [Candidatus Margulisbacteria bacterium GWF2_35_9]